jgi:methionyl aminopeptidase
MPSPPILKTAKELQKLREANKIVADTLQMLRLKIKAGVSTWQLNKLAETYIKKFKATPAFKGYRGFPGSLCVSLNEQVVHGIPSKKVILQSGDILSIDFGVYYKGFYGDSAITVPVGKISTEKESLLKVTEKSLYLGIEQAIEGNRINDISSAVQKYVEEKNFSVVRQFVGHGIGENLHEAPEIPNYDRKCRTPKIYNGMVLAIEPMVNIGTYDVKILKDKWTVITADRKASAHFEHSIAITENGPEILSIAG